MGITGVAEIDDAVRAAYDNAFLLEAARVAVWHQVVDWDGKDEGEGGSSFEFFGLESLPVNTTVLPEKSDPAPRSLADSKITVDWAGYGDVVKLTDKVRFQSVAKVREAAAKLVGKQQAESVDTIIRNAVLGGTFIYMPNNLSARTDLDTSGDLITYQRLVDMVGLARSMGLEPYDGDTFAAIVHPYVLTAIAGLSEFKESAVYRNLKDPDKKPVFRHEAFEFAGIRWIPSRLGKLYLSGGTVGQVATTLASVAAAGAVTIVVTTNTGGTQLVAGDWITIGTLEADDAEQVQITAVGDDPYTTLTIVGAGNAVGNRGLKYAHAALVAVTEAANVAAVPIVGRNSCKGVYAKAYGLHGKSVIKDKNVDLLDRMVALGWTWFGGVGIFPKLVLRGEFAITNQLYGNQM